MEFAVIAMIIIFFVISSSSKVKRAKSYDQSKILAEERAKKMEEEAAVAEAARHSRVAQINSTVQPTISSRVGTAQYGAQWQCSCGQGGNRGEFCTNCGRARQQNGSMSFVSGEGKGSEGAANRAKANIKPKLRHVVEPASGKTAHAHMETSMEPNNVVCEEAYTQPEYDAYTQNETNSAYSVDITDRNAAITGILYSEILGKPKALRNAR